MTADKLTTYQELMRAFEIFNSYEGSQFASAEHDIIYAGPSPELVSDEHKAELKELGWNPSEYDSFYYFT